MQVAIYSKVLKEKDIPFVQNLFDVLHEFGITAYAYAPYLEELKQVINLQDNVGKIEDSTTFKLHPFDFVITLGGDGTILGAITLIRDASVPILGINLGRLGFLAHIEKNQIREAICMLTKGQYAVESRKTLVLESEPSLFGDTHFALNDFTLLKRDTSSMITIHAFINGAYMNTYWADGIIVSTPTGSTGYSLSCGGPIIFPGSGNFVITPVAPHNLNVRPIVISDDSVIAFEVEGRTENFLCTLDSRIEKVTIDHQLAVRRGDFLVDLVQLQDIGFLENIRNKLTWGTDLRNH